MPKFKRKDLVVEAVQLSQTLRLHLPDGYSQGAKINDWLVTFPDGSHEVVDNKTFHCDYKRPGKKRDK